MTFIISGADMWPDVISSGQAVCITVKSGQCTKICLTLFTNVHTAHYMMCSKMCTMHLYKIGPSTPGRALHELSRLTMTMVDQLDHGGLKRPLHKMSKLILMCLVISAMH